MKKLLIVLALLSASTMISAKQYVEYYRYSYFTTDIADKIKADLDKLISSGYRITSICFASRIKCMLVVYEDME